jgi:hypothetical protein
MRLASLAIPASALDVMAVRLKPGGSVSASSPWLIHTWIVSGRPANSGVALFSIVTSA